MIDPDFISRAKDLREKAEAEGFCLGWHPSRKTWAKENQEKMRGYQDKYSKSRKGKIVIRRRSKKRSEREKLASLGLTWEDKVLIREFYENCPSGYEVDHIIALADGGKHCLSNLQYLTPEEHKIKHKKKPGKVRSKYYD